MNDKPARSGDQAEQAPGASIPPEKQREGRRYAVSQQKGKAKGKMRYIETNDPSKGCRFL
jgi:hypothetical protein